MGSRSGLADVESSRTEYCHTVADTVAGCCFRAAVDTGRRGWLVLAAGHRTTLEDSPTWQAPATTALKLQYRRVIWKVWWI